MTGFSSKRSLLMVLRIAIASAFAYSPSRVTLFIIAKSRQQHNAKRRNLEFPIEAAHGG
jgi:hypothetical protein